jgi:hypothetical protein
MKYIIWFGLWCLTPPSKNISVILWRSVLLLEETGVSEENHWPVASQTSLHNVVSSIPRLEWGLNSQH